MLSSICLDSLIYFKEVFEAFALCFTLRILSRPFRADDYLESCMQSIVLSKQSIVQRIFHSPLFASWFEAFTEKQGATMSLGKGVKSLRAAKHRFETLATPTGRAMLWFPSILATATKIIAERKDTDTGREIRAWLEQLSLACD